MMSWTERKYCDGIEGKARVRGGNDKAAVCMFVNCFKNKFFKKDYEVVLGGIFCFASFPQ